MDKKLEIWYYISQTAANPKNVRDILFDELYFSPETMKKYKFGENFS